MAEVNLIPELRFPEFDGDWIETRTKEIAPLQRGFDLPTSNVIEGIYPVVYSNGILRYHNEFKANGPGVVTGRSGTIGKVTYVEKDFWPHNTSLWVTDFKDNIPKFIYYFYINFRLERFNAGSTVPTLNRNDVHFVKKRIPQPEEQQKIASFLTAVDERIQLLQQKKAKLEEYKKGVMQKLFSQDIRFKDEHGNDFPDWEEKRLEEIGEIITGKTPSTTKKELWNGNIDFITPTDIIEENKYQKVVARTVRETDKMRILSEGTIVYTCIASIGKMAITTKPSITNQQINSLIVNDDYLNEFVYYALLKITPKIKATQANTTLPIINKTEFSKFKLFFPCIKEQIKIASFLTSLDASIESLVKEIEGTTTFKKGLLQKMFV